MIRTEHKDQNKWGFSFVEYAPTEKKGKLPLIIQLHGAGERGDGDENLAKVDVHGFSKFIQDKEIDCRFVMPQCPTDQFWAGRVESIVKFVEMLIDEYDADRDRVYLTGLSMGGFGTWYTSMLRPDLFAAIAPVCGGGMPWNAAVLDMPIWAFHGAEDTVVDTFYSDDMVKALEKHQKDVTYTRLDGVGHNAWVYAYGQELLDWLLSKKR